MAHIPQEHVLSAVADDFVKRLDGIVEEKTVEFRQAIEIEATSLLDDVRSEMNAIVDRRLPNVRRTFEETEYQTVNREMKKDVKEVFDNAKQTITNKIRGKRKSKDNFTKASYEQQARQLLFHCVNRAIQSAGGTWLEIADKPTICAAATFETLDTLIDDFETRYFETHPQGINNLFVDYNGATHATVLQELLSDGVVHWGRLVAAFYFAGAVAKKWSANPEVFQVADKSAVPNHIVDWTMQVLGESLVKDFVTASGGWDEIERCRVKNNQTEKALFQALFAVTGILLCLGMVRLHQVRT